MVHLSLQKLPATKSFGLKILGLILLLSVNVQTHAEKTLLVLGDSLSAGYGIEEHQGWVNLLRQKIQNENIEYRVINASISGETTAGGLRRLPELLRSHQPDIVLLELGGNDGLRGFPLNRMQNNLMRMIELCQQHQAQPILLGMQIPPNYGQRYSRYFSEIYPKFAKQYEIPLVPFFMNGVATAPEKMQNDGIHPNASGQPTLLSNTWSVLQPHL